MNIRPMEAELFHAYRWTDMMKLIVAFLNFAKESKNYSRRADSKRFKFSTDIQHALKTNILSSIEET